MVFRFQSQPVDFNSTWRRQIWCREFESAQGEASLERVALSQENLFYRLTADLTCFGRDVRSQKIMNF